VSPPLWLVTCLIQVANSRFESIIPARIVKRFFHGTAVSFRVDNYYWLPFLLSLFLSLSLSLSWINWSTLMASGEKGNRERKVSSVGCAEERAIAAPSCHAPCAWHAQPNRRRSLVRFVGVTIFPHDHVTKCQFARGASMAIKSLGGAESLRLYAFDCRAIPRGGILI